MDLNKTDLELALNFAKKVKDFILSKVNIK